MAWQCSTAWQGAWQWGKGSAGRGVWGQAVRGRGRGQCSHGGAPAARASGRAARHERGCVGGRGRGAGRGLSQAVGRGVPVEERDTVGVLDTVAHVGGDAVGEGEMVELALRVVEVKAGVFLMSTGSSAAQRHARTKTSTPSHHSSPLGLKSPGRRHCRCAPLPLLRTRGRRGH